MLVLDLRLATDRPCVAEIRELSAVTRVLIVSASGRPADVLAAIRAGANGYVTKDAPAELVVDAGRTVAAVVETPPGEGTHVTVRVPLPPAGRPASG